MDAPAASRNVDDPPDGSGDAELVELSEDECWVLLATQPVGRVAVPTDRAPLVVPVNFQAHERSVFFRSNEGTKLMLLRATMASFEVDHIDAEHRTGWSVLLQGYAQEVPADATDRPAIASYVRGGEVVVQFVALRTTGRRIVRTDSWAFDVRGYFERPMAERPSTPINGPETDQARGLWGEQGPGVPSLRTLLASRPRRARQLAVDRQVRLAGRVLLTAAADTVTFHLPHRSTVTCPCCGSTGPGFIATATDTGTVLQSVCPECSARRRHRGLASLLPIVARAVEPADALVFAPERAVIEVLERAPALRIETTDRYMDDVTYPGEDIRSLSLPTGSRDLVVCNHVLEHVDDDGAAIHEVRRVLRDGGAAVFTVPGDFRLERTRVFDEPDGNGHLRSYGRDLAGRLAAVFDEVVVVDLGSVAPPTAGAAVGEPAFVACARAGTAALIRAEVARAGGRTGWRDASPRRFPRRHSP